MSDNDNVSYTVVLHTEPVEVTTITKDEYEELVNSSLFLDALEAAGVENWDGYDLARDIFQTFSK